MITLGDLMSRSAFRLISSSRMGSGVLHQRYRSEVYPRLEVVKKAGPTGIDRKYSTSYLVDGVECSDVAEVLARLNSYSAPPE
jgi:hypothetical protein